MVPLMSIQVVTGASGYLGSWVTKELLAADHTVRGTVRNLSDSGKLAHLHALQQEFPGKLELVQADLTSPGSFDAALAGAQVLHHTASPYTRGKLKDPQAQLIGPAVEGTKEVLAAVNRTASIERVVLTSSIVAIAGSMRNSVEKYGGKIDESQWNEASTALSDPYAYSKTMAEKAAWAIHDAQSRWKMAVINPGAIFGPSLSKRVDGESVKMLLDFLRGTMAQGAPAITLGVVDVRDVALAHVAAADRPEASGRHILVAQTNSLLELGAIIASADPSVAAKMPKKTVPKWLAWIVGPFVGLTRSFVADNVGFAVSYDNQRSIADLAITYRPLLETFREHIAQLRRDKLV